LGYDVATANDGRAALQSVAERRFAAILMDCQMPGLDGFEATRALRALAHGDVPVIAMTAAATNEDRERCLAAGMNDYLSKPVQRNELERTLEKWVRPAPFEERVAAEPNPVTSTMNETNPILDPGVIASLRELGGDDDPQLFAELVNMFLADTPERLHALGAALEQRDPLALERAAHALKSSSANLGALSLSNLFSAIETACRQKDIERAASLVARTRPEYERVEAALRSELH
jgi:CheY-like chemotaxis protein